MKKLTFFFIAAITLTIQISCKKDKEPDPKQVDLDYFYYEERETIFREDFNDNSNSWNLRTDSLGSAIIQDGMLQLSSNEKNGLFGSASAIFELSKLNLDDKKHIAIEVLIKKQNSI